MLGRTTRTILSVSFLTYESIDAVSDQNELRFETDVLMSDDLMVRAHQFINRWVLLPHQRQPALVELRELLMLVAAVDPHADNTGKPDTRA
jgi:hypothetical protein